ncbi:hypothetical protein DFJ74DRAFT_487907 [Hyaloraphidium curvatum]|nr:hypothetical protein DFJ74DRAFT_487907 [Hyaloraphidium curvatum]
MQRALIAGAAAGLGMLALDGVSAARPLSRTSVTPPKERYGFSKDLFQIRAGAAAVDYVTKEIAAGRYSQIDRFLFTAKANADKPFIVFQEQPGDGKNVVVTFREADEESTRLARYLMEEHGVRPGEMIASLHENCPGFVIVMLAAWKLGCPVAYLNYNQAGKVFTHSVDVSSARVLVFEPVLQSRIADVPEFFREKGTKLVCYSALPPPTTPFAFEHSYVSPGDLVRRYPDIKVAEIPKEMRKDVLPTSVASLVYTSGSTGLPKAAILNHAKHAGYIIFNTAGLVRKNSEERVYGVGPLFHANGGFAVHLACMLGIPVCLTRRFSASNFFAFCTQTGVTTHPYVGEFIRFLTLSPPSPYDRAHKVRVCFGNGVRPDIWTEFERRFGVMLCEGYGSTEGNVGSMNYFGKPGAVGFQGPLFRLLFRSTYQRMIKIDLDTEELIRDPKTGFCIECAANEPGEIIGKLVGENFVGYFKNEQATTKKYIRDAFEKGDVWVRSGDLLVRDSQNYFHFVDRLGDTFRYKGENCSTMQVRDVMLECPVLRDCNVYGVKVPGQDGRAGMAAVILEPEQRVQTDEAMAELGRYCKKALPSYAAPRFCRLFETFEATSTVTFKYTKTAFQNDGYDLDKVPEPLYVYDEAKGYVPLTRERYQQVMAGKAKL